MKHTKDGARTSSAFNPMAQATEVYNTQRAHTKWINSHTDMCWKCQKDKPRNSGERKLMGERKGASKGGDVFRFICAECVEERLKIKEAKNDS
jgi:hypothetical protein